MTGIVAKMDKLIERIEEDQLDMPADVQEALTNLLKEIGGFLVSPGWRAPQYQMLFMADRLEHYAKELRRIADAKLLWPDEEEWL